MSMYYKLGIQLLSYMDEIKCRIQIAKGLLKLDSNQLKYCCFFWNYDILNIEFMLILRFNVIT